MKNTLHLTFLFIILFTSSSYATDYYWKGGSGDFNDPTMWWLNSFGSGTTALQAPVSADNVLFNAAAFTTPGAIVTINTNANCRDMVWDNAISVANKPRLTNPGGGTFFDIYGSLLLATNLDFDYRGTIRFRSINKLDSILTNGLILIIANTSFNGSDTTEWKLLDNYNNIHPHPYSGNVSLQNGLLNTNGFDMNIGSFRAFVNSNGTSGVNISNSSVTIRGNWIVSGDTSNFTVFSTIGSHLHIYNDVSWFGNSRYSGGIGCAYDTITSYDHLQIYGGTPEIEHFYFQSNADFYYYSNPIITNWYAEGGKRFTFLYNANSLTVENTFFNTSCDKFIKIETSATLNSTGLIRKKSTNSTLTLDRVLLKGVDCDVSGSRTYVANNSVDAGGNSPNWTINTLVSSDMYFRATTDNLWSNPNNWKIWDGFVFQSNITGCVPTPLDNVFFDNLSFMTADTSVYVDSVSYCNNMTWLATVQSGSTIDLNEDLNMYGTLNLNSNMSDILDNGFDFFFNGNTPNSIISAAVGIYPEMKIERYAFYHIIGNLRGNYLNGSLGSTVHAENISMDLSKMALDTGYYNNVYAVLTSNFPIVGFAGGVFMDYQGTTTFEFSPVTANGRFLERGSVSPNVIMNKDFQAIGYGGSVTIKGNLTMNESSTVYYSSSHMYITGTMPLYNGDVYVTAGKNYNFPSGGTLSVAGTLYAIGTCTEFINWSSGVSTLAINVGASNILYNFINGWNNSGALITATNSIDGGGNTNVNFPSTVGTIFYWRANASNSIDFLGEWNDPDHWTTNESDLVGTLGGCLPTLADTVVFDSMSFSVDSNGCFINSIAYCNTIITKDSIILEGTEDLYIGNSIILDPTTVYNHGGAIFLIGDATTSIIHTQSAYMNVSNVFINNAVGKWNITSELRMKGAIRQFSGDLYCNGYHLQIGGYQHSDGFCDMRNCIVDIPNMGGIGGHVAWYQTGGTLLTEGSYINMDLIYYYHTYVRMGTNQDYNRVRLKCYSTNGNYQHIIMQGTANFKHLDLPRETHILDNNSYDSLTLYGGQFYYLSVNKTQTLSSPNGKITVADVGPGQFVNIESSISGQKAYFHKEYGYAFCLDWIKVKDNEATKSATPPAVWVADHPYLRFETGSNSDNINNSATGIWAFDLPPILTVTSSHADSLVICTGDEGVTVPINITGTYPYSIIYSWTDIWGGTGIDTIVVVDADSNVLTPFVYNLALHPWTTTDYSIDVAALRCGGRNYGAAIQPLNISLGKEELVSVNRQSACNLTNNSVWTHFMDDTEGKPILSIIDSTGVGDTDSLGTVQVQADFDPIVQFWSGLPYLPRHWKVDAANTSAGGVVRLYFSQADLDKLGLLTYNGLAPDVSTQLILWKFDDTITVGVPIQIPFTVVSLAGTATDPFSSITGVYAIEFQVSSFSGFMLQLTSLSLLPLDLLSFDVSLNAYNTAVLLDWETANESDLSHYEVQRSKDAVEFEALDDVLAKNQLSNDYQYTDKAPYKGISYYRLRIMDVDGRFSYSPIRAVERQGVEIVNVYPVPASEEITIELSSTKLSTINISITDMLGRTILLSEKVIDKGLNKLIVPVHTLSTGSYTLEVRLENQEAQYRKIMID